MTPGAVRTALSRASPPGTFRALWRLTRAAAPLLTGVVLLLTGVAAAAVPFQFWAAGAVIRAITGNGYPGVAVAVLAVTALLRTVLPVLTQPLVGALVRRVDRQVQLRLLGLVAGYENLVDLDDPWLQDKVAAARGVAGAGTGPGDAVRGYVNLLGLKLGALGSVLLLGGYSWGLAAGVTVVAVLIRRVVLTASLRTAAALRGDVAGLRRAEYLYDVVLKQETARETKLFGLGGWLIGQHAATWHRTMRPAWARRRESGRLVLVADLAVLVLSLAAAVPIVSGLRRGELGAADGVVLGGALASTVIGLGGFLPEADFPIRFGGLALTPLLDLESRRSGGIRSDTTAEPRDRAAGGAATGLRAGEAMRLDSVAFRYPGADRPVLRAVSLSIAHGETVALVGANGAGKTTLVKVVAGLYPASAGRVLIGDSGTPGPAVAVIFQNFARYRLTPRENIGFGALRLMHDTDALREAAAQAGVLKAIEDLPSGWDTPLSPGLAGGVDLSGGQWQRLALARAVFAVRVGARLLILDEPTASLDVRAEAEFYDRFRDLAAGATTILVSHRLSTVRAADRIWVLGDGRVGESGSHDSLVRQDGWYARMFALQAAKLTDG